MTTNTINLFDNKAALGQLSAWTINLLRDPIIVDAVKRDQTLFAMAYTCMFTINDSILPKRTEEQTPDTRKELKNVLTDLDRRYGSEITSEYGSVFFAGMLLHEELTENGSFDVWKRYLIKAEDIANNIKNETLTAQDFSVSYIKNLLSLSATEVDLLEFQICVSDFTFSIFYNRLFSANRNSSIMQYFFARMFKCDPTEVANALSKSGILRTSGLIKFNDSTGHLSKMSEVMVRTFVSSIVLEEDGKRNFFNSIVKPLTKKTTTSGSIGSLTPVDKELILSLLNHTNDASTVNAVNILAYGNKNIDKKGAVFNMLDAQGYATYILDNQGSPSSDYGVRAFLAQRWLATLQENDVQHILVVDNADTVLTRAHGTNIMSQMFGIAEPDDDDETNEQLETDEILLAENPVATIWLATQPKYILEENVGRFLFHCEVKPATRADRRAQIEEVVKELELSEEVKTYLSKYQLLSAQQVRSAVRLAEYTANTIEEAEDILKRGIHQSQRALQRDFMEELRESVTTYSLDLINTQSAFSPEQVLKALAKRPTGSVCLYGMPGTGKTQFAEYVAMQLDKPIIMKRASDLLGKYVGENEKNIAAMFAEASEEDSILFLDEADSFLRDRSLARAEWSVSQVNELLQQMERFKGIFIVATNLFKDIDAAALRRFTFKFEFLALTDDQRWKMFVNETKMGDLIDESEMKDLRVELYKIKHLTPGDFATVKRQSNILGETLDAWQWIEQLQAEAKAKLIGIERNAIGFTG